MKGIFADRGSMFFSYSLHASLSLHTYFLPSIMVVALSLSFLYMPLILDLIGELRQIDIRVT